MSEADDLNRILLRDAPAAGRCLSPLARRSAFPRGIPFQTAEAKATEINATIGQLTDGHGVPMELPAMRAAVPGLDRKTAFLYASAEGPQVLRDLWGARQRAAAHGSTAPMTTPMVTHGLTQAVSLVADAFADEETDVVCPDPCWENYHLVFQLRPGANLIEWKFFREDGRFNVDGFAEALGKVTRKKAVVIVNFPSNPTGYTPTPAETRQVVDAILAMRAPAVVLFDDAYQGLVYEDGLMARSPYWDLAERCDPEKLFPIKADGATKELFFFGGRVAFLSAATASKDAEAALISKWKCIARSMVGVGAGPSHALVLAALKDPNLQAGIDERIAVLAKRYRLLKDALADVKSDGMFAYPFNSGVFALIGLREGVDAEKMRRTLIAEQSVGTISIPSCNALRVAYCSVADDKLPELARRIARAVDGAVVG